MPEETYSNTIVIGAGLSGLSVARLLKRSGCDVTVLDEGDRVADPWRKRHPRLRLNIHRHFTRLPGIRPPSNDGTFLKRDTVVRYLEKYAEPLSPDIRLNTTVTAVERDENGWRLDTNKGRLHCRNLIVAMGRERIPVIPNWPGRDRFSRTFIHSADIGNVDQYAHKRILIIGAGNSGTDALNHLASIPTEKVWVSVRHGPEIIPARMLGFPLHRLARLFALLPEKPLNFSFKAVSWLAFGNLKKHGLRSHPAGCGTRFLRDGVSFAIDDGFIRSLKAGKCEIVAETESFSEDRVHLSDGTAIDPDVVICATGYRSGLPELFGHLSVLTATGQPRCPMGETCEEEPGIWFTGYKPVFTGYFDAAHTAALRIVDAITRER